jgi:hypothetical protein
VAGNMMSGGANKKHSPLTLAAPSGSPRPAPELPGASKMLAATREAWASWWASPVAATVVVGSDLPALARMFALIDEHERCRREFVASRLVEGSQGQPVVNPLGQFMLALAREIRALEDRFGGSVISRLRLSIDLGTATNSLDAMNARLSQDPDEVQRDDLDPRRSAIDASAS